MTAAPSVRAPRRRVDGVLLLDKPLGLSSNAALQRARRLFAAEKAGHTGTLDPLASGLLPLAFGDATKFAQSLLDARKAYRATVRFGAATTTGDAEGGVVREAPVDVFGAPTSSPRCFASPGASCRSRRATRRSSSRAARITTTPAPASRFRAPRARSRSSR